MADINDRVNSFEGIEKNLEIIRNNANDNISAENVFEALAILIDDFKDYSGNSIGKYNVSDADAFALNYAKVSKSVSRAYDAYKDTLSKSDDDYVDAIKSVRGNVKDADVKLTPLIPLIEQLTNEKNDLEAKKQALERKNQEKERLEKSITALKNTICELDSVSIDELKKNEAELLETKKEKEATLESINSSIANSSKAVEDLEKTIAEQRKQLDDSLVEKERLENDCKSNQIELDEYGKWKQSFMEESKDVYAKIVEYKNQMTVIENAWNSLAQRPDLPECLLSKGDFSIYNSRISTYSDIEKWFTGMQKGIDECLDAYAETYKMVLSSISQNNGG